MFNGVQVPYPIMQGALTDREHQDREHQLRTDAEGTASAPPAHTRINGGRRKSVQKITGTANGVRCPRISRSPTPFAYRTG